MRIKRPPTTPNPGSIRVSRTGPDVWVGVAVALAAVALVVAVAVAVTLGKRVETMVVETKDVI